jgi:hypothetical protein
MPLGYIYGIFLYVNGNDEHFVKVYKDDPKLCWQTIDHKHDLFSEHGGRFFPFWFRRAVACWNFNRAMQMTAKVPHKSVSLKPSLDRNSQPLTTAQRKVVPNIMFSLGTISGNHGRTRENESNSERSHRWSIEELVDNLISLRQQASEQHYSFALLEKPHHLGLMYTPIGGIFPMALPERRMNALQWLGNAVTDFQAEDDPNSLALFSILGPGSRPIQLFFASLQQRVLHLSYHRVTLEVFKAGVLLVWVRERKNVHPGSTQSRIPGVVLES